MVLLGIAVAAMLQIDRGGAPSAISLTAEESTTLSSAGLATDSDTPTTSEVEPFTYRVAVLAGISTSNFWAFYGDQASVWNAYILGPTKPALYSVDDRGALQPELAMAEVSPVFDVDGWRVRIDLNDGFEWSDGHPITADDFVFTFETVRSLGLGGSWAEAFPEAIESIHADSDYELRIEFVERPNLGVWPHGPGLAPLMAAHVWENHATTDQATLYGLDDIADVGGGRLFVSEVSQDLVVSNANPGHPDPSIPDSVEYHVFGDESAATAALREGVIDTILSPKGLTAIQTERLASDPGVVIQRSPANGIRYLGFNLDRKPMNDIAFRNALALLIDREELVADIAPEGEATYTFVSQANPRWFDAASADAIAAQFKGTIDDRLAKALDGLQGAGYTWATEPTVGSDGAVIAGLDLEIDGLAPGPLTILTTGDALDPWRPQYAAEIAETLGWIGFEVRPVETDFDTVVDLAFTVGEDNRFHYDMYLLGWTLGSPSLPRYYRMLFAEDGPQNTTGYASSEFASQLATYENSFDVSEARNALWEMEKTLATDLPYLLLYSSSITEAYRADRVFYEDPPGPGGLQAQLGGIGLVGPAS